MYKNIWKWKFRVCCPSYMVNEQIFIHSYTFPSFLQTYIFKNALMTYAFLILKMEICRNEGKSLKMDECLFVHRVWLMTMNGNLWKLMFRVWSTDLLCRCNKALLEPQKKYMYFFFKSSWMMNNSLSQSTHFLAPQMLTYILCNLFCNP